MTFITNGIASARLRELHGGVCFYCLRAFPHNIGAKSRAPTLDHLWPRSLGGLGPGNKVVACRRCNSAKGRRLPTAAELARYHLTVRLGMGLSAAVLVLQELPALVLDAADVEREIIRTFGDGLQRSVRKARRARQALLDGDADSLITPIYSHDDSSARA